MGTKIEAADHADAIVAKLGAALADPASAFTLLVRFQARAGMEADVESAFAAVRGDTLREPGALAFDLNRATADATRFVVYERWRSLDHFAAHIRKPSVGVLRDRLGALIDGMPEFDILRPAAE